MSRRTVKNLLISNDKYFRQFCDSDWHARGVRNRAEYEAVIEMCACSFLAPQKTKLKRATERAREKLKIISLPWFDGKNAASIKFTFGCVRSDAYENGLPHTVGEAIILTSDLVDDYTVAELVPLIAHEVTHIYQRVYRAHAKTFLRFFDFRRLHKKRRTDAVRSNPDTDGYIYERRGQVWQFPYHTHRRVTSLTRSLATRKHPKWEHPFEWMAYGVEKLVE